MQRSSLYRQWRPRRFDEVVGQEHVVTTLKNAVSRDQVAHAYIFAGPRGTGKTTIARLLAKVVNCAGEHESAESSEPCNECDSCRSIDVGSSMSVVEVDAASHRGIDDIRELQERVPYAAGGGRFRVYILDEAHMLTAEAFNALLKTLEEPPAHVIFILATTEPHKIPVTVQSRCQRFDFRYLTAEEIAERLRQVVEADEQLDVTESAIWTIARYADGAVRDALGLLEQCRDYAAGTIHEEDVRRVTGAASREELMGYASRVLEGDIAGLMDLINEVSMAGADMGQFIRDLLSLARDMLLYRASNGAHRPVMPQAELEDMCRIADGYTLAHLLDMVDELASTEDRTRYSAQPRFLLEMTSIRLAGRSLTGKNEDTASSAEVEQDSGVDDPGPRAIDGVPAVSEKSRDQKDQAGVPAAGDEKPFSDDPEEIWQKVKEHVRQTDLPTHALLQPARPGGIEDGDFLIVFGDQYQFHRDRTDKQGREMILKVLEKVTGRSLNARCVLESEIADDGGSVDGSDDEPQRASDHRIKTEKPDTTRQQPDAEGSGEEFPIEDKGVESGEESSAQEIADMFSGRIVGKLSEMDLSEGPDRDGFPK